MADPETIEQFPATFVVTDTVVYSMVYVVMPRYTRAIRRWLFN